LNTEAQQLLDRAEAHLGTQEVDKAQKLLNDFANTYAPSAREQNCRGVVAVYSNDLPTAMDSFKQALSLDPTHGGAAQNLAHLLAQTGRVENGKAILTRVAGVLRASGRIEDAEKMEANAETLGQAPVAPDRLQPVHDFAAKGIDAFGYDLVDGEWLPWIHTEGFKLFNLPIAHFGELKPEADLGTLLQVGWNQSVRDLKFRFECSSRYVPPHLNHPIQPGDTIVELGAYLGHFSLFLAKSTGPTGRVLAVEFIRENYDVLKQNLAVNFPETTTAVHCGVWSEDGERTAYRRMLQANSFTPHSLIGDYDSVTVPGKTVDTLLAEAGIEQVDLMVITINGTEVEAFKGMTKSLPKIKAFAVAARYGEGDENRTQTVFDLLESLGYDAQIVGGDHVHATRRSD
jgi:FkbM family methyltransferase